MLDNKNIKMRSLIINTNVKPKSKTNKAIPENETFQFILYLSVHYLA